MLSKDTKSLESNQYQKSDKTPIIIYADLESLLEKIDACKNDLEKSCTASVDEHIPSGFSMSTISFKDIENKHDVYRGKICVKKFCESLREPAVLYGLGGIRTFFRTIIRQEKLIEFIKIF